MKLVLTVELTPDDVARLVRFKERLLETNLELPSDVDYGWVLRTLLEMACLIPLSEPDPAPDETSANFSRYDAQGNLTEE